VKVEVKVQELEQVQAEVQGGAEREQVRGRTHEAGPGLQEPGAPGACWHQTCPQRWPSGSPGPRTGAGAASPPGDELEDELGDELGAAAVVELVGAVTGDVAVGGVEDVGDAAGAEAGVGLWA